jgi:hypothetical protein
MAYCKRPPVVPEPACGLLIRNTLAIDTTAQLLIQRYMAIYIFSGILTTLAGALLYI